MLFIFMAMALLVGVFVKPDHDRYKIASGLIACISLVAYVYDALKNGTGAYGNNLFNVCHTCILIAFCVFLHFKCLKNYKELLNVPSRFYISIPAILFALVSIGGYSIERSCDAAMYISGEGYDAILAVLFLLGLYVFFYYAIIDFYVFFSIPFGKNKQCLSCSTEKGVGLLQKYLSLIELRPFLTSFVTLACIYAPLACISYPGLFKWDLDQQILQAFPEFKAGLSSYTVGYQIDPDVFLCNHHPIVHTVLVHICIKLGLLLFNDANAGAFLWTFLQFLFFLFAVSYGICVAIQKLNVRPVIGVLIVLFMALFPRIQSFVFIVTKDVPYATSLLVFAVSMCSLFVSQLRRIKICFELLIFVLSGILAASFRNEGVFVVAAVLLSSVCFVPLLRKQAAIALAALLFVTAAKHAALDYYHVNPGSVREALCLPLQQTARYVVTYPDEVTTNERTAIDKVIPYGLIESRYKPFSADPIKDSWKEHHVTGTDIREYLMAWMAMFSKHPLCYIKATYTNHYLTFYPGRKITTCPDAYESIHCMDGVNKTSREHGIVFNHPSFLLKQLQRYIFVREFLYTYSGIAIIASAAIYTWMTLLLLLYSIYKRDVFSIVLLLLPVSICSICVLGPLNADYGRYVFPLILIFPFLFLYIKQIIFIQDHSIHSVTKP